jgi:C4-dicarboxylate transporter
MIAGMVLLLCMDMNVFYLCEIGVCVGGCYYSYLVITPKYGDKYQDKYWYRDDKVDEDLGEDEAYQNRLNSFNRVLYTILFFIPLVGVLCKVLLKVPPLLNYCATQTYTYADGVSTTTTDQSVIFLCVEIFQLDMVGMVFILFFISLYFDLVGSSTYHELLNRRMMLLKVNYTYIIILRAIYSHSP